MNQNPNSVKIWNIHSNTGKELIAQHADLWLKHIEARQYLKTGNYSEVAQIFNKTIQDGEMINGVRYVVDGSYDLQALQKANIIASKTNDVSLIAQNTGFSETVIQKVKNHFYLKEHLIFQDNKFIIGRFERENFDNALWEFAESGFSGNLSYKIDGVTNYMAPQEAIEQFNKLIFHEYSELTLMESGLSFRGLNSNDVSVYSFGAHDISPTFNNSVLNLNRTTNINYPQNYTELEQLIVSLKNIYKL